MQLSEIVSNVRAELHPATNIDSLIKSWANRAQKVFIRNADHNFSWLTLSGLQITTVAGVAEYVLHPLIDVGKAIIFTSRSFPRVIENVSRDDVLWDYPDPYENQGEPVRVFLNGFSAVLNQPSSASVLTLVSSSASDTTAVVKIEGFNAAGILVSEEITLNGTTNVVSLNQYKTILSRSINSFINGIVTITSNAGAVTIDVVHKRSRQSVYPRAFFHPVPSGIQTIYYDGFLKLPELVSDNDFSLIPEQYHDALEHYCLYRGHRFKNDLQSAMEAKGAFDEVVQRAVLDDVGPPKRIILNDSSNSEWELGRLPRHL